MNDIHRLYNQIKSLPTLSPTPEVNTLFSHLVRTCSDPCCQPSQLKHEERIHLVQLCSQAEKELELYYAEESGAKGMEYILEKQFPYTKNYYDLVGLEMAAVQHFMNPSSFVFLGGGPLPISAYILATKYNLRGTIIDSDEKSCLHSREVLGTLCTENTLTVRQCAAKEYADYSKYDLIILGALVGETEEEKRLILSTIINISRKGTLIVVRSSFDGKTNLYPEIRDVVLEKSEVLLEIRPYGNIINSFFVLRVT